jgi:Brp/Blh family beta-carotene 15,15'-monooxygenase
MTMLKLSSHLFFYCRLPLRADIHSVSTRPQGRQHPPHLHRVAFSLAVLAVLAAAAFGAEVKAEEAPILSAAIILLFGMPHGAFDVALASQGWRVKSLFLRLKFIAAYVCVAAFVVLFWSFFPGESLCAFLALSALHFSKDWQGEIPPFGLLTIGASLICFPALFHQPSVREIFELLVPSSDAAVLSAGLQVCAFGLIPLAAAAFAYNLTDQPLAVIEAAAVLALALAATPLTFFLIYFCGLHSIRHLLHVRETIKGWAASSLFSLAFPYALAAAAGIVAAAITSFPLPLGSALLGSVFIGLAALTVPHMLLVSD